MIEEEIVRHAFPSSLESYGNDPKFVPFSYSIVHLWKLTGGGGSPMHLGTKWKDCDRSTIGHGPATGM